MAEPAPVTDAAPIEVTQAVVPQERSPTTADLANVAGVAEVAEPGSGLTTPKLAAALAAPTPAAQPLPTAVPMPASSIGTFKRREPARMAPPATEDASQVGAPKPGRASAWKEAIPMPAPEPSPPEPPALAVPPPDSRANVQTTVQTASPSLPPTMVRRGPAAPPGSSPPGVAAFRKLPKSERDRPPIDGIGVSGIHVDRIDLGSAYDSGVCQGDNRTYSAATTKAVNVCFRAVHRRQTERVLVKWSKNGRLVRRAWIVIPAAHAYRTRAGIRLRDSYVGSWTVTVESADGVVLASDDFKVTR